MGELALSLQITSDKSWRDVSRISLGHKIWSSARDIFNLQKGSCCVAPKKCKTDIFVNVPTIMRTDSNFGRATEKENVLCSNMISGQTFYQQRPYLEHVKTEPIHYNCFYAKVYFLPPPLLLVGWSAGNKNESNILLTGLHVHRRTTQQLNYFPFF